MIKHYRSYLLRLWQADNPEMPGWLASLEDPHTRQVMSFSSLGRLFEYIRDQTGAPAEESGAAESGDRERHAR